MNIYLCIFIWIIWLYFHIKRISFWVAEDPRGWSGHLGRLLWPMQMSRQPDDGESWIHLHIWGLAHSLLVLTLSILCLNKEPKTYTYRRQFLTIQAVIPILWLRPVSPRDTSLPQRISIRICHGKSSWLESTNEFVHLLSFVLGK